MDRMGREQAEKLKKHFGSERSYRTVSQSGERGFSSVLAWRGCGGGGRERTRETLS